MTSNKDLDNAFAALHAGEAGEVHNETDISAPSIRLLRCSVCKTLEEMPDYVGPPKYDFVLDDLVGKHVDRHPNDDRLVLLRVAIIDWEDRKKKRKIHKEIWGNVTGFVPEYYDTKNTYMEDAAKCHSAHHRSFPCIDYKNQSKRLGNPTSEGWKSATPASFVFLCDFCPVKSRLQEQVYKNL